MSTNQKVIVLILLLVMASSWFFRKQEFTDNSVAITAGGPDAYADNVTIRVMDAAGNPVYHLRAAHIAWYQNSDQLALRQPQLDVTRPDGSLWQLNAEQGRTGSAGDPVSLSGEVIIQRLATTTQNLLKITTADVTVRPDARTAHTEQAARIESAGYHFETQGLTANFINNRLELHSQVRGHIDGSS